MFKGTIIHRYAHIRSRQLGALGMLFISFLIGILAASEYLVYALLIPFLAGVIFYFIYRSNLKELNTLKGYLEIDTDKIRVLSLDRDHVVDFKLSDIERLTFNNTDSLTESGWYQSLLEVFGLIKHPTIRFEYGGITYEYFFIIDSFYMHEQLKSIQALVQSAPDQKDITSD